MSSCSPTPNIVPHTSLHDQPCHKTMRKYEDFEGMVIYPLTRRNSRFEHGSVIVHNIFAYFALSLSTAQVHKSTSLSNFHIGSRFCFFFFEVVVIDAWSRYFVELLCRLVCQLIISFHTLLCMTHHVIRP